ncbi:hypothetical protein [Pseudomonas sp. AO-1]|uniref:hypothetical protein n=1 Tax=Pseudomonas sp. AO-1 TaxID=2855434 RepID=UPI0021B131FC|nr:hypothetical protein [Pseudomonas sp. AO-1]
MPWYKAGTVSVVQNSNAVIGTGTAFIANSRVGDAFRGPDGGWYEVTNIASDTALSISPNYQGATNNAGIYALAPMQGYVKDSADALRALVNQFGSKLAALGTTGNYDILPVQKGGTGAGSESAARLALSAAKSGANSDITELSGLTKPIAAAQGGVGQAYIEGLAPRWLSSTSLGVDSGAAFVPGAQKTLVVTAPLTKSGLSGAAPNTWYYLYLFDNGGVPDLEVSTTAPAIPYVGQARTKAGDTSRRFLFAARSGPSGFRPFIFTNNAQMYVDVATLYLALTNGTATGATVVDCSAYVPPTTQRCILMLYGAASGGALQVGYTSTTLLSCASTTRYQADTLCNTAQQVIYSHGSAVTGGSSIEVRGYGLER